MLPQVIWGESQICNLLINKGKTRLFEALSFLSLFNL